MSSDPAPAPRALAFWLFGLSGAGKSTLAQQAAAALRADGRAVLALDGDRLRAGLCNDLAFGDDGRRENLRRAAEVARLGLESGLCVVASFITPFEEHRQEIARIVGADALRWVHVHAPLDTCRARDVKGLYAQAARGAVTQFTGLTSRFEPPSRIHLLIDTANDSVGASTDRLLRFMRAELLC